MHRIPKNANSLFASNLPEYLKSYVIALQSQAKSKVYSLLANLGPKYEYFTTTLPKFVGVYHIYTTMTIFLKASQLSFRTLSGPQTLEL